MFICTAKFLKRQCRKWVISTQVAEGNLRRHFRSSPKATVVARRCNKSRGANSDQHRKQKRPPRGGLSEIRIMRFDQAATAATFFRFLRQPSRPSTPRPVVKSGRAAGRGVAVTAQSLLLQVATNDKLSAYPSLYSPANRVDVSVNNNIRVPSGMRPLVLLNKNL